MILALDDPSCTREGVDVEWQTTTSAQTPFVHVPNWSDDEMSGFYGVSGLKRKLIVTLMT